MRFASGEIYHIYNRGVEGRDIFMEPRDYKRFLLGLIVFNTETPIQISRLKLNDAEIGPQQQEQETEMLASILAYVLMKNHVHLLIYCHNEEKLALFLQKIFVGYTMYFNAKYGRRGVLFQSGSQSKHISDHRYLSHMINYIHLNPLDYIFPEWRNHKVKNIHKTQNAILDYPWSSLKEVLGKTRNIILNKTLLSELFPEPNELLTSMLEWSSEIFENSSDFIIE